MVRNGGKICLDGRKSESHPYGCVETEEMEADLIEKRVTVQGWLSKAHVSCSLSFISFRDFMLTLSNLVFHNSGIIIGNVNCFSVVVTDCAFVNSSKAIFIVQRESRVCNASSLVITGSKFFNNTQSVLVSLFNRFFSVKISKCVFQGKVGRFPATSQNREVRGAVYIGSANYSNRVDIFGSVTDSIFRELGHEDNSFALSFRNENFYSKGNLTLSNTTFLNNENGLFVFGGFDVQLTKVTVNSTYWYGISAGGPPKLYPNVSSLKVCLEQCILWNNNCGVRMATRSCSSANNLDGCSPSSQTLVVKNSIFLGGYETQDDSYAIRFWVKGDTFLRRPFINAELQLENVTFQGLHHRALSAGFQSKVKGMISVKNCKFINNSEFVDKMDGRYRGVVEMEFDDEDPPNCPKQKREKSNNSERTAITRRAPVIFEDSIFQNNVGVSAALDFLNANVTFKNCIFKDNQGLTVGGHVYMEPGYGSVNIVNSTFLQTYLNASSGGKQRAFPGIGSFLHSESLGPITITNSSFTANVLTKYNPMLAATRTNLITADATSTFRCPSGNRIQVDKIKKTEDFQFTKGNDTCLMKVTYVKLFCEECRDGFYSLQRGLTTGLDINKKTMCLKCPYGASCVGGNIKAKVDFWGLNMSTNPPSLQFFPCPLEYCSSPEYSNYYTYNACFGNRSGVLCGKCSDGYSEALYSTSCRKKDKCNAQWFWLTTAIYVVLFAVYFVFKPPILSVLYKKTLWFKNRTGDAYVQRLPQEDDKEHDPGYLKIIFYFYQVAELVMIKSPEKALHMVPFIPSVIAIFNFQVKLVDGSVGCPFPGLTVVTKELFLCLKFLATLLSVGFIFTIHRAASSSRFISSPRITVYLAVALEILLLGYERLADTTLNLMHCVPIGMDWHLFVDGNIQCWQWWQYLLIVFMMVFIIPLVVVLFWGSLSLANDRMSSKEFLTACAFPLPCLLVWVVRRCKKREDNDVSYRGNGDDSEEIKKVLHDPFRAPSCDDHGTLYWESVLTGRRLILLTIHTFATDPMVKFLCLDCACVLILVHHLSMRPFRDRKANIFESLSLVSLFAICTFSLAEATYFSEGIEPTGPSESLFHTLQWIEIVVLGLVPVVVGILLVFTLLSQVVRLLYFCVKLLSFKRVNSLGHLTGSRQRLLNGDTEDLQTHYVS